LSRKSKASNKNLSKDQVITSGIVHNFNNLMGVIVSHANLLARKVKDASVYTEIDLIRSAALEASEFVQKLRDPKRENRYGKNKWVDLNAILTQVVDMTKPQWQKTISSKKSNPIRVVLHLNQIPKIYASETALREVFINMMLNAIDALRSIKEGSIVIRSLTEGKFLKIQISDSGAGMSKSTLRQSFKPFFTTKGSRGSGLGLSTSYEIVRKYKGAVDVDSIRGVGTTFTIIFPIPKRSLKKFQTKEKDTSKATPKKRKALSKKILIVDDEKDYRQATAELLTFEGYRVDQASGGVEALRKISRKKYDVVLSDAKMPNFSGQKFVKAIKDESKQTKIIFISGYRQRLAGKDIDPNYIDGWIVKPCMVEDIKEAIERVCQ